MNPLISVVVPVYNAENYLTKCLESIASQTYTNLEILLIDDGSTDSSGRICDKFAINDSRVKVIHKPNGGVSSARNLGMEIFTGEYLMFVDADDYMSKNAVECLYHRLREEKCDLAIGRYVSVYEGEVRNDAHKILEKDLVMTKEQALSCLGTEWNLPHGPCGKLYTRTAMNGIIFPPIRYGEDDWVFPHVLDNCKKIAVVSNLTYYYLIHPNSAIHTAKDGAILESISAMLHIAAFLETYNMKENALAYYNDALWRAMRVKDRKKARKLIVDTIDRETKKKLLHKGIKTRIRWISLYLPFVFTWVKKMQSVLFRKAK